MRRCMEHSLLTLFFRALQSLSVWPVIVVATFSLSALPADGAVRPFPESVEVRALANREARNLRLLVRVPLSVIRDIPFPVKRDTDYLDLSALQTILPAAARYWIQ